MSNKHIQRTPEIDKLYDDVLAYSTTASFKELLEFEKKFLSVGPYNAMLVYLQKPGSSYVASTAEWRDRFGRNPKPGARPLLILRPFGPVSFVYELNDTEGKAVPDEILQPFARRDQIALEEFLVLEENLMAEGVRLIFGDYGTDMGGLIKSDVQEQIRTLRNGKKARSLFAVVLNKNHSLTSQYTTIIHELGHLFCGHLGNNKAK